MEGQDLSLASSWSLLAALGTQVEPCSPFFVQTLLWCHTGQKDALGSISLPFYE